MNICTNLNGVTIEHRVDIAGVIVVVVVVVAAAVIVLIMTKTKRTMSLIKDYYVEIRPTCNLGTI